MNDSDDATETTSEPGSTAEGIDSSDDCETGVEDVKVLAFGAQQDNIAAMMRSIVSNPALEAFGAQQDNIAAMMRSIVSNPALEAIRGHQDQHAAMMRSIVSNPALEAFGAQQDNIAAMMRSIVSNPALEAIRGHQIQHAAMMQAFLPDVRRVTERLNRIAEVASRTSLDVWPGNLRGIEGLTFDSVRQILLEEGIPLSRVPRHSIAKALLQAPSASHRRAILGRRWSAIADDCEELLLGCVAPAIEEDRDFALNAVAALQDGHSAASQALSGNLLDSMLTKHFRSERVVLVPSRKVQTPSGYDAFVLDKFWALAPVWAVYKRFFPDKGDPVPRHFARHATAHAVSRSQFSRRNAVQAVMVATSLIGYLDRSPAGEL